MIDGMVVHTSRGADDTVARGTRPGAAARERVAPRVPRREAPRRRARCGTRAHPERDARRRRGTGSPPRTRPPRPSLRAAYGAPSARTSRPVGRSRARGSRRAGRRGRALPRGAEHDVVAPAPPRAAARDGVAEVARDGRQVVVVYHAGSNARPRRRGNDGSAACPRRGGNRAPTPGPNVPAPGRGVTTSGPWRRLRAVAVGAPRERVGVRRRRAQASATMRRPQAGEREGSAWGAWGTLSDRRECKTERRARTRNRLPRAVRHGGGVWSAAPPMAEARITSTPRETPDGPLVLRRHDGLWFIIARGARADEQPLARVGDGPRRARRGLRAATGARAGRRLGRGSPHARCSTRWARRVGDGRRAPTPRSSGGAAGPSLAHGRRRRRPARVGGAPRSPTFFARRRARRERRRDRDRPHVGPDADARDDHPPTARPPPRRPSRRCGLAASSRCGARRTTRAYERRLTRAGFAVARENPPAATPAPVVYVATKPAGGACREAHGEGPRSLTRARRRVTRARRRGGDEGVGEVAGPLRAPPPTSSVRLPSRTSTLALRVRVGFARRWYDVVDHADAPTTALFGSSG